MLAGKTPGKPDHLLADKVGKGAGFDDLSSVEVERETVRSQNHRWNDRHRLTGEHATIRVGDERHEVELVNLSAGGAMIRGDVELKLWDTIGLSLGEGSELECAVRWIRRDRFGLEFAHETQIHCTKEQRDSLLLDVLRRRYPDVLLDQPKVAAPVVEVQAPVEEEEDGEVRRGDDRHPLIWMGDVHFDHSTSRVRLRNVSESGALVEGECSYPVGATVLLDLDQAGQHFALVVWSRGPQSGLSFERPFDVASLAGMKPMVTPKRWARPTFLRTATEPDSPWATQGQRASLEELRDELEGFMKR